MPKPLKVLHTNMHKGGWGGQPNRILLVSKALTELGHHVVIAAPKGATLIKKAKELGIPTFDQLEFPKKFKPHIFIKEVIRLKKLIEEEKIDIVHTHGSQDTWVASIAAKLSHPPRPVVRTRHNTFFVKNHLANRFLYRVLIDHLIVVSEGITDVYKKSGVLGEKINRVKAIYSVVDPARFKNASNQSKEIQKEFSLKREFVFIKVGRLAKEKGHEYFLKAAQKFLNFSKARFFALGEGPQKNRLKELAFSLGISRHIAFTGLREDVPGFLALSDMFVFTPTAGESLGTAVLEALYMRVPVCAFKVGGVDASVEPGKSGFLYNVGDLESLVNSMKMVFQRKLIKKLGLNGRKIIEKKFLLFQLVKGNLWVYREILKT